MPRLTFFVLLILAAPAFALTPTFIKIADNTTTPGGVFLPAAGVGTWPMVNDSGFAVFNTASGTSTNTVYAGNGGPVQTVSQGFNYVYWWGINNAGTIALSGVGPSIARGIYTRSGTPANPGTGAPATIITAGGTFNSVGVPVLSANGYLAFTGDKTSAHPGGEGAYRTTAAGGPITTIAEVAADNDADPTAVNNAGTVLYFYTDNGNFTGVKTSDETTVTDYGGTDLNNLLSADINNAGTVSLTSTLAVAKFNGPGSSTVVAQVPGAGSPFASFFSFRGAFDSNDTFSQTGIADNGTVAFGAKLSAAGGGGNGIFIGGDSVADKVIKTGDPLFGSTLSHFLFGGGGISDDGQHLAFAYELANGESGVAVATLPEPSALLILVIGAIPALRRHR
jgi:hypothetical protein